MFHRWRESVKERWTSSAMARFLQGATAKPLNKGWIFALFGLSLLGQTFTQLFLSFFFLIFFSSGKASSGTNAGRVPLRKRLPAPASAPALAAEKEVPSQKWKFGFHKKSEQKWKFGFHRKSEQKWKYGFHKKSYKSAPNLRKAGQECKADVFETKCDILQFLKWTNMWCIKNIKNALVKYQ